MGSPVSGEMRMRGGGGVGVTVGVGVAVGVELDRVGEGLGCRVDSFAHAVSSAVDIADIARRTANRRTGGAIMRRP
jgi:hypothetical protein